MKQTVVLTGVGALAARNTSSPPQEAVLSGPHATTGQPQSKRNESKNGNPPDPASSGHAESPFWNGKELPCVPWKSKRTEGASSPGMDGMPWDIPRYLSDPLPRPDSWACKPPRLGRLDRYSQVALLAAHEALRSAALAEKPVSPKDLGLALGTAYGCHAVNEEYYVGVSRNGPRSASPRLFTATLPSAPVGEMAIAFQALGPALTLAHGWDAGLAAVIEAVRLCRTGRAQAMIAGGCDILSDVLLTLLNEWGLCTQPSEGAAFVVVESMESATQRGAEVLATVLGWAGAFSPNPRTGNALERAMVQAINHAGIPPQAIARIVRAEVPEAPQARGGMSTALLSPSLSHPSSGSASPSPSPRRPSLPEGDGSDSLPFEERVPLRKPRSLIHGMLGDPGVLEHSIDPSTRYGITFGAGGVLAITLALEALDGPTLVAAEDPLGSATALVIGPPTMIPSDPYLHQAS